tara:strand:+ start:447 stop:641 length:195 start_codon:yes stop_codon:yes gene_type:complete
MSIAKNAMCSQIMRNVESGKYAKQSKFANYGSVPEDSPFYSTWLAEQAEARREIRAQQKIRSTA